MTAYILCQRRAVEGRVEPRTDLADFLRHELQLTGTHRLRARRMRRLHRDRRRRGGALLPDARGAGRRRKDRRPSRVCPTTTDLTPLQAAFRKHHALQCGFCTPGILTTAHALLSEEPDATRTACASALRQHLPLHRLHPHRRGGLDARASTTRSWTPMKNTSHRRRRWSARGLRASCAAAAVSSTTRASPGMLHAAILRSSVAHGRIARIDTSAALKTAGRACGHHRAPTCRAARRSSRCGCSRCRSSSRSSSR